MQSLELINLYIENNNLEPYTKYSFENQNKEYEGIHFFIGNQTYRSRLAKLTPKKKGYFVAFWEKDENNKNTAYHYESAPDFLIINIIDKELKGQFIFPKEVLLKKGVLSYRNKKGKMAMRVYPTWIDNLNETAYNTQKWQDEYFSNFSL